MECDQRIAPKEKTHLPAGDPLARGPDYFGNHEEPTGMLAGTGVIIDLGALLPRQKIFDGEGMELVLRRERVDDMHVAEPAQVDPAHLGPRGPVLFDEVWKILDLLNQEILRVVVDTVDRNRALSRRPAREVLQFDSGGNANGMLLRR